MSAQHTPTPVKKLRLTTMQRRALECARDGKQITTEACHTTNCGGAFQRMRQRLCDAGLLRPRDDYDHTWSTNLEITDAGRAALAKAGAA